MYIFSSHNLKNTFVLTYESQADFVLSLGRTINTGFQNQTHNYQPRYNFEIQLKFLTLIQINEDF